MDVSGQPIGPIFKSQMVQEEFFWDVTQRRLVFTDVSVQFLGPIFKSQMAEEEFFFDVTHRRLVVTYGRFGTTDRSHFQKSNGPRRILLGC